MELSKNKLYLFLFLIAIIFVVWIYWPKTEISKGRLNNWIIDGYTQQFCNVIYPRLQQCVTFGANACPRIAEQEISACLAQRTNDLTGVKDQAAAKKIYDSFMECFRSNIHTTILNSYMVDTPECQDVLQ